LLSSVGMSTDGGAAPELFSDHPGHAQLPS
jgi:hypothetical protein